MLIERRTYTLQPGTLNDFWDAQRLRGDGLQPILERLIGVFSPLSGMPESVISLYRYDSFADWQNRLGGLYGDTRLSAYFSTVRTMIVRQENEFLLPAGFSSTTPMWGNGSDWLPAHGAPIRASIQETMIVETTLTFRSGGVPRFWQGYAQHEVAGDDRMTNGLLGAFNVMVGPLNCVRFYRRVKSVDEWIIRQEALAQSGLWATLLNEVAPALLDVRHVLLRPSRVADMSPMFSV